MENFIIMNKRIIILIRIMATEYGSIEKRQTFRNVTEHEVKGLNQINTYKA